MPILVILLVLWALGYLRIPGLGILDRVLFTILGHGVTIWEIIMFLVILYAGESLPSPLRQIAYLLVILWLLSVLGIVAVAGFSQVIVLAIVIGLILALFQKK